MTELQAITVRGGLLVDCVCVTCVFRYLRLKKTTTQECDSLIKAWLAEDSQTKLASEMWFLNTAGEKLQADHRAKDRKCKD